MTFVTCECTCSGPYADGTEPSFYTDEKKAAYMWAKLKRRASLFIGVHLNGLHILTVKET